MPVLLPIIVGIAIAAPAIGAVVAGAAIAGLAGSLILLGSSLILSGVSRALVKTPSLGDFETKAAGRLVSARQAAAPRMIRYGLQRLGGVVTFLDKRGTNGEFLDVVLTLSGHEVEEIGTMYFDGVSVPLDASGVGAAANATGKFAGHVRVQKNLGADSQAALSDLVTASSKWTSNHRQRGCAHVWVELKFNPDLFPNGTPQITFDVKGAKVFDTRTSTTAYSPNAALCLRDYLTKTRLKGGAGIAAALIPDSFVDAAANLADEDVTLDLGGTEDRYTCNGTVSTAEQPGRIIQQMLSAMAGKLVFSGGQWLMYGGAWRAPTVSFDEDDLVGPLKVESRLPRRELFNAVKGIIVTAANKWQPSDFPPYTDATFETEDGERLWKDVDFPFTTSAATAQRLAKLDLLTARQQKTVRVRMNLKALQVNPPDVIQLTVARFSWTNKSFEIAEQQLIWDDAGEAPALVVEMLLRETASTVYDWTAASDEDQPTAPETPTLPDPSVAAAPTGLTLSSFSITRTDGMNITFLKAAWTPPTDEFVTNGGKIELEYKKNADSTWLPAGFAPGQAVQKTVAAVDDDVAYDVRIRSHNIHGAKSAWVQSLNFTVIGVFSPPVGPANLTYRPLTNPLTATDAGATATVTVAGFTMRIAGLGDKSITAGSVTGLSFDTVYFIRYDDLKALGGSVTFVAETVREDALNNAGRFFVGTIRTPKDGGADTTGLGDGGGGAQLAGLALTLRPQEFETIGSFPFTNAANAFDGLTATFARGFDQDTDNQPDEEKWFAFQLGQLGIGKISVTLKIDSEVIKVGSGNVTGRVRYSTNGGLTWTNVYSVNASRSRATDSVALGSVDIGQLQIEGLADWNFTASTSVEVKIYEIFVEMTQLGA